MRIETQEDWWDAVERLLGNPEALFWISQYISPSNLEEAHRTSDHAKVTKLLNAVWWRLPDIPEIHRLPCFYLLCDICSEAEVVHVGT